ncbi:MAG: RnfABCDGE type electron transport complex subunit G [Firmicutes bacterium]|nr:RnfABCDGE type electron transport complex subunit G [Bacillota bacterium]
MKTKNTPLFIVRLALTLFVICAVVAILLALVNQVTAPRIETINAEKATKALTAVLSDADQATKLDDFQDDTGMVRAVYASPSGYAIEVTPAGFGGTIDMMVGVSKDGKVLGVSIISHSETPNLGAVAASSNSKGQAFREQFIGLSGALAVSKDGGSVDAITSATITSRAVTSGVNAALECAGKLG